MPSHAYVFGNRQPPLSGTGGVLVDPRDGGLGLSVPLDVVVDFGQRDHLGLHPGPVPSAAHRVKR